ncbi:carbonic anhydrase [Glycomyces terrestris]|uniref:Carbonic anhydrase n=1 Tax=Glycomyces terrestris TaxID=2493553 RepID=A0A426V5D7_9ACTN|nr:carbonic anhydrase [Glycomyces terrestris]RRS02119.1 carbonic anhydrase [Glycomyces terrestris]
MSTLHIRGDRRTLITGAGTIGLGATAALTLGATPAAAAPATAQTASLNLHDADTGEEVWEALLDGNERWACGRATRPHTSVRWRKTLVAGQQPRAAVFGCVDSRVSPELVFDTGVGDIMVTRTAGNVLNPLVAESVSYGPAALASPLLVVLGHQKCGAVTAAHAALSAADEGHEPEEHEYALPETVEALRAAYEASKGAPGDPIAAMTEANVRLAMAALAEHPNLATLVADGELTIVGAVYSLETGLVTEIQE